ncbi:unnamed protein product [Rhizophagus irregularis]|nr:unnamed protein product [Rhizophagus irregularis]
MKLITEFHNCQITLFNLPSHLTKISKLCTDFCESDFRLNSKEITFEKLVIEFQNYFLTITEDGPIKLLLLLQGKLHEGVTSIVTGNLELNQ